jgi:thioredoxin 1
MSRTSLGNLVVIVAVVALVAAVAIYRQGGASISRGSEAAPVTSQPAMLPRMIDLGADRCKACKEMAPILVELRDEYAGRASIEFIDVWKDPSAAETYGVRVIPTQIFYDRQGNEVWRHAGFLPKADIVAKLKELGAE